MMGEARFVDGSGLVEQGRMIKSPRELDYMRAAARAAQAGVAAGIGATRAGATEADVAIAIHRGQLGGGERVPGNALVRHVGARSIRSTRTWSPKRLVPGDVVFLEVPGVIHRYHAALTRAAWIGGPPPDRPSAWSRSALERWRGQGGDASGPPRGRGVRGGGDASTRPHRLPPGPAARLRDGHRVPAGLGRGPHHQSEPKRAAARSSRAWCSTSSPPCAWPGSARRRDERHRAGDRGGRGDADGR